MRTKTIGGLIAAAAAALALAPAAQGDTQFFTSMQFKTDPIQVGNPGTGTLEMDNNSTGQSAVGSVQLDHIFLSPSCQDFADPPCEQPEFGVFDVGGATGAGDCAGIAFNVVPAAPPFTNALEFVASGGGNLLQAAGDVCTINFSYTALKMPSVDTQPGEDGTQTNQTFQLVAEKVGLDDGPINFGGSNDFTTVTPAPPGPVVPAPPPPPATHKKCKKKKGKKRALTAKKKRCKKKKKK